MQITQELCKRPGLNKAGFEMPTIFIPTLLDKVCKVNKQHSLVCHHTLSCSGTSIQWRAKGPAKFVWYNEVLLYWGPLPYYILQYYWGEENHYSEVPLYMYYLTIPHSNRVWLRSSFFHKIVGIVHLLLHFKCIESSLRMNVKSTWQGRGWFVGRQEAPSHPVL